MKLTEVRKNSSSRLFILKEGVSSTGHLTKFKEYAQELLDAKVKWQFSSNGYLYPLIKVTAWFFVPVKTGEIPTVGLPSRRPTWGAQSCQNLMKTHSVYRSARNVSWANKKALPLTEDKT